MNSEPDLLRIEVVDDEIVVSLPKSQLSVSSLLASSVILLPSVQATQPGHVGILGFKRTGP